MLITDASKIYIGSAEIGAVYVGATKVWPATGGQPPIVPAHALLMHFDEQPFIDYHGNPITVTGGVTQVDGGLFGKAAKFDNGAISVTGLDPANLSDWTIECAIKQGGGNAGGNLFTWEGQVNGSASYFKVWFNGNNIEMDSTNYDLEFNHGWGDMTEWKRIALSCSGGTINLFWEGQRVDGMTGWHGALSGGTCTIGNDKAGASPLRGVLIDELRWTPDHGLYGGNYTLATGPFPSA